MDAPHRRATRLMSRGGPAGSSEGGSPERFWQQTADLQTLRPRERVPALASPVGPPRPALCAHTAGSPMPLGLGCVRGAAGIWCPPGTPGGAAPTPDTPEATKRGSDVPGAGDSATRNHISPNNFREQHACRSHCCLEMTEVTPQSRVRPIRLTADLWRPGGRPGPHRPASRSPRPQPAGCLAPSLRQRRQTRPRDRLFPWPRGY